jgi:hypothetical protein
VNDSSAFARETHAARVAFLVSALLRHAFGREYVHADASAIVIQQTGLVAYFIVAAFQRHAFSSLAIFGRALATIAAFVEVREALAGRHRNYHHQQQHQQQHKWHYPQLNDSHFHYFIYYLFLNLFL